MFSNHWCNQRYMMGTPLRRRSQGLEVLSVRRWYRRVSFFYKIIKGMIPVYLTSCFSLINQRNYDTRSKFNSNGSPQNKAKQNKTKTSNSSFLPHCIDKRNKLNLEIQNIEFYKRFKDSIISFIKTKENPGNTLNTLRELPYR